MSRELLKKALTYIDFRKRGSSNFQKEVLAELAKPEPELGIEGYLVRDCHSGTYGTNHKGEKYFHEIPEYSRKWEIVSKEYGKCMLETRDMLIKGGEVSSNPNISREFKPLYTNPPRQQAPVRLSDEKMASILVDNLNKESISMHDYNCAKSVEQAVLKANGLGGEE